MSLDVRRGNWAQTFTGVFWPLDPLPEEVCIEDIAHALSMLCRFGGHSKRFYSVAQHSVLVSLECAPADALAGLLHDAAEAYVGDMICPLKRDETMREYRWAERAILRAIGERFGFDGTDVPPSVVRADLVLLATEARDVMGGERRPWNLPFPPSENVITTWSPEEAEATFLARFQELTRA